MSMKHLPNILSSLRIVGAVALLLCDVVGTTFWSLYALCGISDIADVACYDFRWLQFFSSLVPVIIAWCYWPGVKEKATM